MTYIKEAYRWATDGVDCCRCTVTTNTYAKSPAHVASLAAIAVADFPTLRDADMAVVTYRGSRRSGVLGIEFTAPSAPPADYVTVGSVEPIA